MGRFLRRRSPPTPEPRRSGGIHTPWQVGALRASGMRADITNRRDIKNLVRYRQPWQRQALEYRNQVGELREATILLGNAVKSVRFFPATYVPDPEQLDPIPMEDGDDTRWAAAGHEALHRLGGGNAAGLGQLAAATMKAFKVPGEGYLVGRTDTGNGVPRELWEIRSISEVGVHDNRAVIRDAPSDRSSDDSWMRFSGGEPLGPGDFIARVWTPSDEFRLLADSPVNAAIPTSLSALVLLGKQIEAEASSRLASRGVWLLDERIRVASPPGPGGVDSAEDDEIISQLIDAGRVAIRDPGSAEAAFPYLLIGPGEAIEASKYESFSRPDEKGLKEKRDWLLQRLATTLELPAEFLTGMGDHANHWSAFLLDDQRWRDHVDPGVRDIVAAWVKAYYHNYLLEAGVPAEVVARSTIWYDPTRAVVKSDRSQAAAEARARNDISGEAYRRHLGFGEDEAPNREELLVRAALGGVLDPASALAVLTGRDPIQVVPAPATPPAEITPAPDDAPPAGGPPNGGNLPATPPPAAASPPPALTAAGMRRILADRRRPAPTVAAATPIPHPHPTARAERLSRRLLSLDRDLRAQLRMAAEATARRVLERAGARLVSKARGRGDLTAAVAGVPAWAVPARLGPAVTAALGLDEEEILAVELAALELLWTRYVSSAQQQAVRIAAALAAADADGALEALAAEMAANRTAGWDFLAARLAARVRTALAADPSLAVSSASLVPVGVVRAALALAGGFDTPTSAGLRDDGRPVDPGEGYGQVGTGGTVSRWLVGRGEVVTYQWVHGSPEHPFEPHEELDGKTFSTWADSVLSSDGALGFGSYFPGDHDHCSCDVLQVWSPPIVIGGDGENDDVDEWED